MRARLIVEGHRTNKMSERIRPRESGIRSRAASNSMR